MLALDSTSYLQKLLCFLSYNFCWGYWKAFLTLSPLFKCDKIPVEWFIALFVICCVNCPAVWHFIWVSSVYTAEMSQVSSSDCMTKGNHHHQSLFPHIAMATPNVMFNSMCYHGNVISPFLPNPPQCAVMEPITNKEQRTLVNLHLKFCILYNCNKCFFFVRSRIRRHKWTHNLTDPTQRSTWCACGSIKTSGMWAARVSCAAGHVELRELLTFRHDSHWNHTLLNGQPPKWLMAFWLVSFMKVLQM